MQLSVRRKEDEVGILGRASRYTAADIAADKLAIEVKLKQVLTDQQSVSVDLNPPWDIKSTDQG